ELAHVGVAGVELGEGGQVPPGIVVGRLGAFVGMQRPASDVEPIYVRGIGTVLQDVVELEEAAACVVEDAVEYNPYTPRVGSIEQRAQGSVAAEQRVDVVVVVGVVAVVGRRLKDRVE